MTEIQQFKLLSTSSSMMEAVKRPVEKVTEALRELPTNIHGILPRGVKAALALPLSLVHSEEATTKIITELKTHGNTMTLVEKRVFVDKKESPLSELKNRVATHIATGINVIKLPLASGIAKAKQVFKDFLTGQSGRSERFLKTAQNASQHIQDAGKQVYDTFKAAASSQASQILGKPNQDKINEQKFADKLQNAEMYLKAAVNCAEEDTDEYRVRVGAQRINQLRFDTSTSKNPELNKKLEDIHKKADQLLSANNIGEAKKIILSWTPSPHPTSSAIPTTSASPPDFVVEQMPEHPWEMVQSLPEVYATLTEVAKILDEVQEANASGTADLEGLETKLDAIEHILSPSKTALAELSITDQKSSVRITEYKNYIVTLEAGVSRLKDEIAGRK